MPRSIPSDRPRVRAGLAAALILGCSLLPLHAAWAETLADAAALAYQTNPQLLSQRAQLRSLNENYVEARTGFGARLSADATGYTDSTSYGPHDYKADSASEQIVLTQPLFTGGRASAGLAAAEADVKAGRERLRQSESDLLQRVVNAYVSVRRDEQILEVARATVTVLQEQLQETQAKVNVQENTRTDLAQAQARLASARAQLFAQEAQLGNSRAAYLNAVGQNPGALAPEPDLPGLPASIDGAFNAMESENRTLRASKFAELASRARVTQAKAQNLPTIDLRVQATRSPQALYVPSPYVNSLTAQATISQPLFTGGQTASGIRRALENNNSDRLLIDNTRRNIVQTLSQQWNLLSAARSALEADQLNVKAAETAFFGMRQEERFGLRSTIEVLNTQQELNGAQVGLLRDRYSEYVERATVLNLMGRLTIDVLAPGAAAYDPLPDFDKVKNKGALPTDFIVRVLDSAAGPGSQSPLAARETAVPDNALELPPAPPPAADTPAFVPITSLMDQTRLRPTTP